MKTQAKIFIGLLTVAAACSSRKHSGPGPAEVAAPNSEDQILNAGMEDTGVINFFDIPGQEKGLVIKSMGWGQPISSDNPGADCELKRRQPGPPTAVFACVVRDKAQEAVVLTLHEDVVGEKHGLKRITMDGKSAATRDRWIKALQMFGYTKNLKVKARPDRTFWLAPDRKTEVQVVWAQAANAVTLIFDPANK